MTPFTEEQRKKYILGLAASGLVGVIVGALMAIYLKDKQVDRLEAKIFKLEGWQ